MHFYKMNDLIDKKSKSPKEKQKPNLHHNSNLLNISFLLIFDPFHLHNNKNNNNR